MNFRGEVRITVEQVFRLLEASGPVEVGDRGVLLQSLHDLRCLLRQGIAFVRGRVVGLVEAVRKNVDHGNDGNDHQNIESRVGRVLRLSGFEPLLIPLHYDLQRRDSMERAVKKRPRNVSVT